MGSRFYVILSEIETRKIFKNILEDNFSKSLTGFAISGFEMSGSETPQFRNVAVLQCPVSRCRGA
jgi:hypothetical protein